MIQGTAGMTIDPESTPPIPSDVDEWVLDTFEREGIQPGGWLYYPQLMWLGVNEGITPSQVDASLRRLSERGRIHGNSARSLKVYLLGLSPETQGPG